VIFTVIINWVANADAYHFRMSGVFVYEGGVNDEA